MWRWKKGLESGFRSTCWAWTSAWSEAKDTEGEDILLPEDALIPLPKGQDQSGRKEDTLWPCHCTGGEQLWLIPVHVLLGGAGRLRGVRGQISSPDRSQAWGRSPTPFGQQAMEEGDTWIFLSCPDPLIREHSRLFGLRDCTAGGNRNAEAAFFCCPREKKSSRLILQSWLKEPYLLPDGVWIEHIDASPNSRFPRSKAEKWVRLANNSKHSLSFLLQAWGLKPLQNVHFLGIYVPPQGNKVVLYSLQMREICLF